MFVLRWSKCTTYKYNWICRTDDDDDDDNNNNNNNNNKKVQRIKSKQLDNWQYQYLHTVLESLTGTKNCKN